MLTDVELGLRLRARTVALMLAALDTYRNGIDPLSRVLACLRYDIYCADYRAIQGWLRAKMFHTSFPKCGRDRDAE